MLTTHQPPLLPAFTQPPPANSRAAARSRGCAESFCAAAALEACRPRPSRRYSPVGFAARPPRRYSSEDFVAQPAQEICFRRSRGPGGPADILQKISRPRRPRRPPARARATKCRKVRSSATAEGPRGVQGRKNPVLCRGAACCNLGFAEPARSVSGAQSLADTRSPAPQSRSPARGARSPALALCRVQKNAACQDARWRSSWHASIRRVGISPN